MSKKENYSVSMVWHPCYSRNTWKFCFLDIKYDALENRCCCIKVDKCCLNIEIFNSMFELDTLQVQTILGVKVLIIIKSVTSSCIWRATLSQLSTFLFFEAISMKCFRNVSQWNVLFNNFEAFTRLSLEASVCFSSCCASSWAAVSSFLLHHHSTHRNLHNLHNLLLSVLSFFFSELLFLE